MVKNIFLLIKQVEESGEKVTSTSLIEVDSEEGGERIRESSNDAVNYIRFINNIISIAVSRPVCCIALIAS